MTILYILMALIATYLTIGSVLAIKLHQPRMILLWFVLFLGSGVH